MDAAEQDLLLLRRFSQTGDQSAFAEIVRRYAGVVYAACQRVVHNPAMAEEVAQETFFRLMKQPTSVSQSLGAWLHRAATNLAVDAVRSDAARRRREADFAEESARREAAGVEPEANTWAEISPFVDEALAELPDEERVLLVEHFLRGRPQNELAAEARTSAATMSRRIRAAVEALQQKLRKRGLYCAPLPLAGFLHDHALQAAPASMTAGLGKMAMVSSPGGWGAGAVAAKTPIWGTAAWIVGVSVVAGWVCMTLAHPAHPTKGKGSGATSAQARVMDR